MQGKTRAIQCSRKLASRRGQRFFVCATASLFERSTPLKGHPPDPPFFYFKIKQGWVWEVSSKAGAGSSPLAKQIFRELNYHEGKTLPFTLALDFKVEKHKVCRSVFAINIDRKSYVPVLSQKLV